MNNSTKKALITLVSFVVYVLLSKLYYVQFWEVLSANIGDSHLSSFLVSLLLALPIAVGALLLDKAADFPRNIGLQGNIRQGLRVGWVALFTFMLLIIILSLASRYVLMIFLDFLNIFTSPSLLFFTLLTLLLDAIIDQGFIFRNLFQHTRLGVLPIVLIIALVPAVIGFIFFLSHPSYSGTTLWHTAAFVGYIFTDALLLILLNTFWIAWLYVEWKMNIWVVIFVQMVVNLLYMCFHNLYINALIIASVVIYTVIYKRKHKLPFEVNKDNLWVKKHKEEDDNNTQEVIRWNNV
jgi:putative membrane protein